MTGAEAREFFAAFISILPLILLCSAAAAVMLGLCVYNDARYRGDTNAVLWGVLSGFFAIAGLIYLIVKLAGKKFLYCMQCGRPVSVDQPVCPACGAVSPEVYRFAPPEQRQKQGKRRFLFLGLYIGVMVLSVILIFVLVFSLLTSLPASAWH